MMPWWLSVLFVLACLGLGYAAAAGLEGFLRVAQRVLRVSHEDVLWWTVLLVLGALASVALLPAMYRYCEPSYTCPLLP